MSTQIITANTPPANPYNDFVNFIVDSTEYQKRVAKISHENLNFVVELEDIYSFDHKLAYYVQNQPELAIEEFHQAIVDKLRIINPGVIDDFRMKIHSKCDFNRCDFEEIVSKKIGKLVQVDGEIAGISEKYSKLKTGLFECEICSNVMQEPQHRDSDALITPKECSNPGCKNNRRFHIRQDGSEYEYFKYFYIQSNGASIKMVYNETIGQPGDRIKVWGILRHKMIDKKNYGILYVDVNNLEKFGANTNQEILKNDVRIFTTDFGIYMNQITEMDCITERLFSWEDFKITSRYRVDQGTVKEWRYSGYIQLKGVKHGFDDANTSDIKSILKNQCAVSGKNINFCTVPLQAYLSKFLDNTNQLTEILGFTNVGWKLPDNSIFRAQDQYGLDVKQNLEKVLGTSIDFDDEICNFQNYYKMTGIKYKDLLFQWSIFSPFLHVFREIYQLMPCLALQGPAQHGKSAFMEGVMFRWFGHYTKSINSANITEATHLEGLLATSTLPIYMDEITYVKPYAVDMLKSHATSEGDFMRKGGGQTYQFASVKKPKCASLSMGCNLSPHWFRDDAFLQRLIILIIDFCEQIEGWKESLESITVGSILQLIRKYTQNWTKTDLKNFTDSIKVPDEFKSDNRKKAMYRCFASGQKLLSEIFGIETSLDGILELLNQTRQNNSETLISLMRYQVDHGQLIETQESVKESNLNQLFVKKYYLPIHHWVKTPIYETSDGNNWAWTVNNFRELQTIFEGHIARKWTTKTFLQKVRIGIPSAEEKNIRLQTLEGNKIEMKRIRAIIIPKSEFIDRDD